MDLLEYVYSRKTYSDEELQACINRTQNLNVKDINDNTPLHIVCKNNNFQLVKLLVENGADIHATNIFGNIPAFYASVKCLQLMIDKLNLDHQNNDGYTLLMYIADERPRQAKIKMLVDAGANVALQNKNGCTALHLLMGCNHGGDEWFECVKLLANEQTINLLDNHGKTPLIRASNDVLRCIEILLQAGADVNIKNKIGQTYASLQKGFTIEKLNLLIKYGLDLNMQNPKGNTIIFDLSIFGANEPRVQFLIDNGIDLNIQNNFGNTVAHHCVLHNSTIMASILSQPSLDLTIKNNDGFTVLDLIDKKVNDLLEIRKLII